MKNVTKQLLKAVCFLLLFVGMQVIVSVVFQFGYGVKLGMDVAATGVELSEQEFANKATNFLTEYTNWILIASNAMTVFVLWLVYKIRKKNLANEASIKKIEGRKILPLIIMGIAMSFAITCVLSVLPIPEKLLEEYTSSATDLFSSSIVAQVLSVIVLAPITEEILFRGMILSRLKNAMNPTIAIIISSLAFGVIHGHPIWIAYAFVCGIIFAVVAESSKSIVASILLHMAFNSVSIIGGGIELSDVTFVIVMLASFALLVGLGMYVMKKDKTEVVA